MSKEIYISSTPHETRLAIVEDDALTEIYYERENEYTLAGSIYNGKVTRVLPGMQSSFVDIGLERDAFLYITDFMEEAGDSADFEASVNGTEPRAARPDGHREQGRRDGRDRGRGDRSDRSRNLEPTDAEQFTSAVNALEQVNPARSGRDGNSGRERQEARRGGRNGSPRRDEADRTLGSTPPSPAVPEASAAPFSPDFNNLPESELREGVESVGEGAPGADGSRRWRGRRGRRGTRVAGRDEQSSSSLPLETEAFGSSGDSDGLELDASTAAPVVPDTPRIPTAAASTAEANPRFTSNQSDGAARGDRSDRDRGRGDRNGRSRRGDRNDRAGHPDREQAPRAPRGFAPRNLYGAAPVEEAGAVYGREVLPEAPAEPVILPGEVLSKYRPVSEQPAASAAPQQTPKPSSEFRLPSAWDGGFVLPGETLRRRESNSSGKAAAVETDAGIQTLNSTFVAPPPLLEVVPVQEAVVEQEFEPTEGAASFRVERQALVEYRQPAQPVQEVQSQSVEPEFRDSSKHLLPEMKMEGSFTDDPESPLTLAAGHQHGFGPDSETTSSAPTAEVTSILASGEMHSMTTISEPALMFAEEQEVPAIEVRTDSDHPNSFSPGSGFLEEEVLDEEDEIAPVLHGSVVEIEDIEEQETLEGVADLGTMIREMSIDQITRSTAAEAAEDEDADEEDFLEEDQNYFLQQLNEADEDAAAGLEQEVDSSAHFVGEGEQQEPARASSEFPPHAEPSEPRRRNEFRREGRRSERDRGNRSGGFSNNREGSSDRPRREGRSSGGRQSAQATNLPAISDLLKPGQELLCQIAKEPIARKGARITSHIALPGRFLVFMPTVNHTGVSRKIESDAERRRLKEILISEKGEAAGGFIVRTAAANATEQELRSDLRFLLNLWADIKTRSESSKSPALIYHDLNLVERVLRDQVTDTFSAIWVDTETEYERVLRFLQRFQPSLLRRVKLYTKETPLFEQFGITEEINKALRSKVWLKSGGSIVINQTEALVAIDINTGKFVGKTARLEDTIVKTNLDAIPEIVRQIRLRDLGGIIIIDFIDMDDRKNRNKVMAVLEEELKSDRAPSKVLQFNDFGLVAITRKRVKQSLERTLSTTCGVCAGTGMVKSPVSVCNDVYIEMRKMHKHLDRGDVMLRVHPEVVKQLKSPGTKWLQEMEEMVGKTILVKSDPALHPEQFDIH